MLCLYCNDRLATRRGLCNSHYVARATDVRLGKTTWEAEIEAGRATAAKDKRPMWWRNKRRS